MTADETARQPQESLTLAVIAAQQQPTPLLRSSSAPVGNAFDFALLNAAKRRRIESEARDQPRACGMCLDLLLQCSATHERSHHTPSSSQAAAAAASAGAAAAPTKDASSLPAASPAITAPVPATVVAAPVTNTAAAFPDPPPLVTPTPPNCAGILVVPSHASLSGLAGLDAQDPAAGATAASPAAPAPITTSPSSRAGAKPKKPSTARRSSIYRGVTRCDWRRLPLLPPRGGAPWALPFSAPPRCWLTGADGRRPPCIATSAATAGPAATRRTSGTPPASARRARPRAARRGSRRAAVNLSTLRRVLSLKLCHHVHNDL